MTLASGFNPRKAAQVVAYLTTKAPQHTLNIVKAVKLVYLADRESFARYGFPILDENRVSMPHGPVNSTTYSFIGGELEDEGWSEFLQDRANHEISVTEKASESDWEELSDADIECLDAVWQQFGHMNQWELREWTHDPKNIPEWEDPNGSSYLIPVKRILTAMCVENASEQAGIVDDHKAILGVLARLKA